MTSSRIENQGRIDRERPLRFTFDGIDIAAFEGDTIASALLANGVGIVGRSFKYHRPRGIWGFGVEEPNAIVDVRGATTITNARATTVAARDGMAVRSVNTSPTAAADRNAFIDRFARFIPAAFYYKTFMFPDWHLFEPRIRRLAGLGTMLATADGPRHADQVTVGCDILVVGAGPAGLLAALRAAEAGRKVILCDDGNEPGGSLLHRSCAIDGLDGHEWARDVVARLSGLGATVLSRTTAFGIYDHGLVALNQAGSAGEADRLWRVRPAHVVLATGAMERPLPFAENDLPGIMSAEAGLAYLRRYGILPGRKVVVATNNGLTGEIADALAAHGASVTVVDARDGGSAIVAAGGKRHVERVTLNDGRVIEADAVLVSGGFTPTLHLFCQARGKLQWDEKRLTFLAGDPVPGVSVAGAAAGEFSLEPVLGSVASALSAAGVDAAGLPTVSGGLPPLDIAEAWPKPGQKGRIWVDFQNDVTTKDVELAARENFVSVEHLKRYTTLGMATDQGKTSNVNGLALMAQLTDRTIPEVGTTTYRPPFTPVPLTSLTGMRTGSLLHPLRRLPIEDSHRADGARMMEYGGWLRPGWYGGDRVEQAMIREAKQARETVGLFDASPLGKIEVIGPQAAEFLDFVFYNTVSTLKPGRCRYGLILSETGIVYDDGVLVRLDQDHFIVSCSSSHVQGVHTLLEEWRQDRFDRSAVFIHNATSESATLTVTGPQSKALLEQAGFGIALDDEALPHMATAWGSFGDLPLRVTRVSFTGDRSYELSVRADRAPALWSLLKECGQPLGATPIGMEALLLLRAEKGFIVIGKDTDGTTMPMDLGVSAPLRNKKIEFIGKRSLITQEASRNDRRQLVGLETIDDMEPLAPGAHGVETENGNLRSIGYITSSYFSPVLDRPIALALIDRGASRHGESIDIQHMGTRRRARIAPPCAFDPEGSRLNG